MNATFWALVPPLLAIIVSLITKEVNFSLLIGIIMMLVVVYLMHVSQKNGVMIGKNAVGKENTDSKA